MPLTWRKNSPLKVKSFLVKLMSRSLRSCASGRVRSGNLSKSSLTHLMPAAMGLGLGLGLGLAVFVIL